MFNSSDSISTDSIYIPVYDINGMYYGTYLKNNEWAGGLVNYILNYLKKFYTFE